MTTTTTPFDVDTLLAAQEKASIKPSTPVLVKASDGIELAVRVYSPSDDKEPKAILIFYHGGGAHSGAGYPLLAKQLATEFDLKVYTPDIRGHGESHGPRGDAPNPTQIYQDIDTILEYAKQQQQDNNKNIPIFCGGHSSGGGLMIQYATAYKSKQQDDIQGYVMLSPQLGPNSNVDRNDGPGFYTVSVLPFILNGIFGIMGHNPAVKFHYSEREIKESGSIPFNTVNMANAISPTNPGKQLEEMSTNYSQKIHLWMGQEDELFDSEKVKALYEPTTIVPEETHLGILINAHQLLGPWIVEHATTTTTTTTTTD